MSGGPLALQVFHVDRPEVGPGVYIGAGANTDRDARTILKSGITANKKIVLTQKFPPTNPGGTPYLVVDARAAATANKVDFILSWASVAALEDQSSATLNSEGTSTFTWSSGQSDVIKVLKIALDADTVVYGEYFYAELVFQSTSNLAADSGWKFYLTWE